MDIIYRPARKEDCLKLGELDSLAGEGVLEFLLEGLVPGMTAAEVAAHDMAENQGPRSFRNVLVAETNGKVKGMAFSFHSQNHCITDDMRKFIPAERLTPLEAFFSTRVEDSLYLDALAVDPDLQGHGIGKRLVELTKQKALDMGFGSLSLIVFEHNQNALGLYRKQGFQEVRQITLEIPELLPEAEILLLMECKLAAD